MSASSVYCHILKGNISVVSDLNGQVTNVICPEFLRLTHTCSIKARKAGGLGQLINRIADRTLGTRAEHCEFITPGESPSAKFANNIWE